jgi:hypothetical protein
VLDGGGGNDTASYAHSSAAVSVDLLAGSAVGGDAQGDTLVSIESLIGSGGSDTLRGNADANAIHPVHPIDPFLSRPSRPANSATSAPI